MLPAIGRLLGHRSVLLLQGPVGDFFTRLAAYLERSGASVAKVNFNGGDWWQFRGSTTFNFSGRPHEWTPWLRALIAARGVDAIVCFGDCRAHHRSARTLAAQLGLGFYVFEEGYLRPDFITLEIGGVNAHSGLRHCPIALVDRYCTLRDGADKPTPVGHRFGAMARAAMSYYLAAAAGKPFFPHYRHHRSLSVLTESIHWVRSAVRKWLCRGADAAVLAMATGELKARFFLVALQVHNDSQVHEHSDFDVVPDFIDQVMASFAADAGADQHLVIKHHPMDRGYHHYGGLIRALAQSRGLLGRVHYCHDVHLPTLLRHSRGVVTINSTVGLQAIFHGRPVKPLGRALYNEPGLTHQGELADFWRQPQPPDRAHYKAFRAMLLENTQLNGSFYGPNPWMSNELKTPLSCPRRVSGCQVRQAPHRRPLAA